MITLIKLFFLRHKAALIGIAVAVVIAAAGAGVLAYGDAQYKAGRAVERAAWAEKYRIAVAARDAAQADLNRLRQERDAAIHDRDRARAQAVVHVVEEIQNAPDVQAAYAAYLTEFNRLRDDTAARHARVRADYLSSLGARGGAGTGEPAGGGGSAPPAG